MSRAESKPPASADHQGGYIPTWSVAWDIRRVANKLGHPPTMREQTEHGEHSPEAARARFGSWLTALRATGLTPRLCQRHLEGGLTEDMETAAQAAYDNLGRPPTTREVCDERGASGDLKYEGRWDDNLEAWGVPRQGKWVADVIAELLDDRHPWQSFIGAHTSTIADESDLHPSRVGTILTEFASGERDEDVDGRFVIERREVSRGTRWRVWPVEAEQ